MKLHLVVFYHDFHSLQIFSHDYLAVEVISSSYILIQFSPPILILNINEVSGSVFLCGRYVIMSFNLKGS